MSEQLGHWENVITYVQVTEDIHGNPIANSLGEPLYVTKEVATWEFVPEE